MRRTILPAALALALRTARLLGAAADAPSWPIERVARSALQFCRCLAFWLGVALPLSYVPLLLLIDHGVVTDFSVLLELLALNCLAFVAGHDHDPSGGRPRSEG